MAAQSLLSKEVVDRATLALEALGRLGFHKVFKHHLAMHYAQRSRHGNPALFSTYEDEHINGRVAAIAATAHVAVWSKRVQLAWRASSGGVAAFAARER